MMMSIPFYYVPSEYVEYLARVQYSQYLANAAMHQQYYMAPAPAPTPVTHDQKLSKLQLSGVKMMRNGFPMRLLDQVYIQPNEYQQNRKMFVEPEDCNRVCVRCHKNFLVSQEGLQARSPTPICFNPITRLPETFHVTDQASEEELNKFQSAEKDVFNNGAQMFALDVELVFTAKGQEVGRVTMVDECGKPVLDLLVRPEAEVLDPMTRFSGLVLEDLANATETLDSARQQLLSFLTDQSILVGHGLYGDLKALRIVHNRVIDTSVIFWKHERRPSLRHLTAEHLGWSIQQGTHCSHEDALAALKLVFFAIDNSHFLAPDFEKALKKLE